VTIILLFSASIFVKTQKWIDLRQIKTQLITGPFYTYRGIHFTSRNKSWSGSPV